MFDEKTCQHLSSIQVYYQRSSASNIFTVAY